MKKLISVPLAVAMLAPALTAPYATADEEAPACENPGYAVTSGTLKWGVKQSFRSYIKGPIAHGTWTTSNVAALGEDSTSKDFAFGFEVDPARSRVFTDGAGNIKTALVETQQSNITFTGHDEALYTEMISPYVQVRGAQTEVGSSYVGYYVEGKTMPNYEAADHVPANRTEGKDTFTEGDLGPATITKDGDSDSYTIEFSSSKLHYVPKPGTRVEQRENGSYQYIEGVDVLFLGFYEAGEEFDDYTVSLKAKKACLDSPADEEIKDGIEGRQPSGTTQTSSGGSETEFGEIREGWSIFLAVLGAISMFAILSKLLVDIIKPFLPKF